MNRMVCILSIIVLLFTSCKKNEKTPHGSRGDVLISVVDSRNNISDFGIIKLAKNAQDKRIIIEKGKFFTDIIKKMTTDALTIAGYTAVGSNEPTTSTVKVVIKKCEFYSDYNDFKKKWFVSLKFDVSIIQSEENKLTQDYGMSSYGQDVPIVENMEKQLSETMNDQLNDLFTDYIFRLNHSEIDFDLAKKNIDTITQRKSYDFKPGIIFQLQ